MSDWDTETCEECGQSGNRVHPITNQVLFETYNDEMLCASCRVDKRLEDGDYSND